MLLKEDTEPPRCDITWTKTRPTTSSIMAALVRTVPSLVVVSPLVRSIVNVVPRLVEQRAAPAANACRGVADTRILSENENSMGNTIPVIATVAEGTMLAFNDAKEVERPPTNR